MVKGDRDEACGMNQYFSDGGSLRVKNGKETIWFTVKDDKCVACLKREKKGCYEEGKRVRTDEGKNRRVV
ncbi:NEAT domain-containing protein [Bacillus sp. WP8]|uniref:NEAT domain-containing protein n=1 Tax=Bacillus sp. WP8 TaxID=756828 RepID=UPI0021B4C4D4|nr:NEAT domain-containing protein [Bacillus sp. WP8]